MAKVKRSDTLITLRCSVCKRKNYYTRKNKKTVERKIEFKKFCKWCRKTTPHKEARITGK
jgi:large subunit ribosomal protein L33